MAEFVSREELLDNALTEAIGPVDAPVSSAIVDICNDAIEHVLGSALTDTLLAHRHLVPAVTPWVWDLARGLHFQSRYSRPEPPTGELLIVLARRHQDPDQMESWAETVDLGHGAHPRSTP